MCGIRETLYDNTEPGKPGDLPAGRTARQLLPPPTRLGISRPAVSLQVRQLEQFLQTRLLERTGRGIKATAAGMALLAHSEADRSGGE